MTAGLGQPAIRHRAPVTPGTGQSCSVPEAERIKQAKNLLLNPHFSFSEIACHLGFQSLVHFNRSFKHITGQSPRAYRLPLQKLRIDLEATRPTPMKTKPAPHKLRILILYSDRINGAEAMRTCDRVLKQFEKESSFEFRLWRLDLLDQPDIRAQAIRDVAAVDMVVVTADNEPVCSESFHYWAQRWPVAQRGARRALVSLRSGAIGGSPAASRSEDYLRDLAQRKGMDFLSNHSPDASSAPALPVQVNVAAQELQVPRTPDEPRAQFARASAEQATPTFRRWGINE